MSHLLFRSTLLSALVAVPALVAPDVVSAAVTELGTPRYDAKKKAVVIPYFGVFPTFVSDKLNSPPRVYFDFAALPRTRRLLTRAVRQSPALVRWTIAPRPGGLTRVVLQFKTGADVLVLNDASRRQIVLTVQEGPAPAMPAVTQPTSALPPPPKQPTTKVPEATRTFFQTFGHTDFKYSVGPRPKHAKHDRVTVEVAAQGVSEFNVTADPANDFINFSISIAGKGRATPRPRPTPTATPRAIWTPPPPRPSVLATPTPLTTPGVILEPSPLPKPTSTPVPPPPPTPEPSPEPVPDQTASPTTTSLGFIGGFPVSVSESSDLHLFEASSASIQGLAFDTRVGDWVYHLNVDHHRLEVTDEQTQNLTGNARDTYMLNAGAGYYVAPWSGAELIAGAGYHVRYLNSVTLGFDRDGNSVGPIFPPQQVSVLNAPSQMFHGPTLHSRLSTPFAGALGFDLRLGGGLLLSALDVPENIGPLFAFWSTPALYYDFGPARALVGYDVSLASGGGGYNFSRLGPLARVEMRF